MKNKLFLFILAAVVACSESDEPAAAQRKTYSSIEGVWKIESQNISGQFEIFLDAKTPFDQFQYKTSRGFILLYGKESYPALNVLQFLTIGSKNATGLRIGAAGSTELGSVVITLMQASSNDNFTKITSVGFNVEKSSNCNNVTTECPYSKDFQETVTLTRIE